MHVLGRFLPIQLFISKRPFIRQFWQSPFFENGLDKLLSEVGGKTLIATNDYDDAISKSNLTYILTATPSNQDGSFSN